MITFNNWHDVKVYFVRNVPIKPLGFSGGKGEIESYLKEQYDAWAEENYNHNPTFTVKEQDSLNESDAWDRNNHHQQ